VLAAHAGFALFVVIGGALAWRWRALRWLHVPAVLWAIAVELGGWICPLTPLENRLRAAAGQATYGGDFLQHYLLAALYPAGLTRGIQFALAALVVLINVPAYYCIWRNQRTASASASPGGRQR
jgi:hypothetical protein